MKKFYVSPIFPLILGIVAFGVLSVQLVFVTNTLITLFLLLLILGSYSLLFIHQRDYYSKSEVEQIQYVNHQAEDSLTTLLEQMPVGVIKLDLSSGEVEWFNPYAELILTNEVGEIDVALIQTIIKASVGNPGSYATLCEIRYSVHMDKVSGVLYFFDVSGEYEATVE